MGVTQDLAEYAAATRHDDFPAPVRANARLAIVDALGTVFAGLHEDSVRLVRDYALAQTRPGRASVLGCGVGLAASGAALANAAAAHAIDYDSISLTVSGFIASPVLFALLAVAEEEGGVSGRRLIEAFVTGWEVEAAIARGLGVDHYARGWHSTATLGHFGAAIGVARLLGLDARGTRSAIGVAASEASGVRTMIGNMVNPFHVGKAARNGVTAARLAQSGFVAHPDVLETGWGFCTAFNGTGNYDLAAMTAELGVRYDLVDPGLVIKVYPCCGLIHSALDGVLDLVTEHDVAPGAVRRARVAVHELVPRTLQFDRPKSGYEAKFSAPFCVATALAERSVRLAHFTDEATRDPALVGLMERVEMTVHPELRGYATFLEREWTDVALELADGRVLERRVPRVDNRGSRGRPVSFDELARKARDCASGHPEPARIEAALALLADLEAVKDVCEITSLLR